MVSDTSFTPTSDSWSNAQLGAYNPKAKFARSMSPYRRFAELLYDGEVEAALVYLMNECYSGFLLIDEIQHCLRQVMPVEGNVALMRSQPNIALATRLSPELATLLERLIACGKITLRVRNGWPAGGFLPVSVKSLEAEATFMLPVAQRRSRRSRLRLLSAEFRTSSNYDAKYV
jgi:hypothetical protein